MKIFTHYQWFLTSLSAAVFINGCGSPDTATPPTPSNQADPIEGIIAPDEQKDKVSLLPFESYYHETLLPKIRQYRAAEGVLMHDVRRKIHEAIWLKEGVEKFSEADTAFVEGALTTFFDARDAVEAEKERLYAEAIQHYHEQIKTRDITGERASLSELKQAAHTIALFQSIPSEIKALSVPELLRFIGFRRIHHANLQTQVFSTLERNPRLKALLDERKETVTRQASNYIEYQGILNESRGNDWFHEVINRQLGAELSHRWGINFQGVKFFDYHHVTPEFKEIYDAVIASLHSAKIMPGGGSYHGDALAPIPDAFSQMALRSEKEDYKPFVFRMGEIIRTLVEKGLYNEAIPHDFCGFGFSPNQGMFLFHSDLIEAAYQHTKERLLAIQEEALKFDGFYDQDLEKELNEIKATIGMPKVHPNSFFYITHLVGRKPVLFVHFNQTTGSYETPKDPPQGENDMSDQIWFDGEQKGAKYFGDFLDTIAYKAMVKPLIVRPEFAGIFDFLKTRDGFKEDADFMRVFSTATLEASLAVKPLSSGFTPRIVRLSPGILDLSRFNIQGVHGGRSSIPLPVSAAIMGDVSPFKRTHNLLGTVMYHLPHSCIGMHHAFANLGEGLTIEGQHTESSLSLCHSWRQLFLEIQSGWIEAAKLNSGNWAGYRHQLTLGYDAEYISPFITIDYRHLSKPEDDPVQHTAGYIGLEASVFDIKMEGWQVGMQVTAKIGGEVRQCKDVERSNFNGMIEWSSALNLDSGFAVKGHFVMNPIQNTRSMSLQFSFTQ